MASLEVVTRRRLPHWYVPHAAHFVTYRLYGTLPQEVRDSLRERKEKLLTERPQDGMTLALQRERAHKILFRAYDDYLDHAQQDLQWLPDPAVAAVVRSNLYHHDNVKYHLLAYCVMPNHVHVLLQPIGDELPAVDAKGHSSEEVGERPDGQSPLSRIMHSLKSYTAHEANKLLGRTGHFWQAESYDHWVRDDEELERIVQYIEANPVKARLVQRPEDWYFCSCHDRYLADGVVSAWLPHDAAT